jgi:hypothetical protein
VPMRLYGMVMVAHVSFLSAAAVRVSYFLSWSQP